MANIIVEIKKPLSILFILSHVCSYLIIVHLIIRFVPFKINTVKGALFAYYACYLGLVMLIIGIFLPIMIKYRWIDAQEFWDFVIKFIVLHAFALIMVWYVYVHNAHFTWEYLGNTLQMDEYTELIDENDDDGIVNQESLIDFVRGSSTGNESDVSSNLVGKLVLDSQMFVVTRAIVLGSWMSMLGTFILDLQG